MLKSTRNESSNGEDNPCYLIYCSFPCIGKPDSQTYKNITENTETKRLHKPVSYLMYPKSQNICCDTITRHMKPSCSIEQSNNQECANKVCTSNKNQISQKTKMRNLSIEVGNDKQSISREEFCTSNHHQNKTQRKCKSGKKFSQTIGQSRARDRIDGKHSS